MKLDFRKNLGNIERSIRIAVGLLLIGLVYNKTLIGWISNFVVIFAIVQFIEAYFGY